MDTVQDLAVIRLDSPTEVMEGVLDTTGNVGTMVDSSSIHSVPVNLHYSQLTVRYLHDAVSHL